MKRLLTIIAAAGLLLLPAVAFAQAKTGGAEPSPISQTLVREGDFALDLAAALKLGEPATEAEAEDMLTAAGVSPKNGWIADYPITPDILVELQDSVLTAADSGNIPLGKDDAYKAFTELAKDYGLPVKPGDEKYAGKGEGLEYGNYSSAQVGEGEDYYGTTVVENYYYTNEPPVITYYTPPWDYYYLYSWVPYPFWWYGYYYPGYYILNDFTVVIDVDHHHHHHRSWSRLDGRATTTEVVSNHFRDRSTGRVETLSPFTGRATRAERRERRSVEGRSRAGSTFTDVKAANSILSRDTARAQQRVERRVAQTEEGFNRTTRFGDKVQNRSGSWAVRSESRQGRAAPGSVNSSQRSVERATRLGDRQESAPTGRSFGRSSIGGGNRSFSVPDRATRLGDRSFDRPSQAPGFTGRSFNRPSMGAGERSFSRPSISGTRSFSSPSMGGSSRSFSRPSMGGGSRSFSAPSMGGGGRSFSRPSGGGGFNGGGFRGCRGGRC